MCFELYRAVRIIRFFRRRIGYLVSFCGLKKVIILEKFFGVV